MRIAGQPLRAITDQDQEGEVLLAEGLEELVGVGHLAPDGRAGAESAQQVLREVLLRAEQQRLGAEIDRQLGVVGRHEQAPEGPGGHRAAPQETEGVGSLPVVEHHLDDLGPGGEQVLHPTEQCLGRSERRGHQHGPQPCHGESPAHRQQDGHDPRLTADGRHARRSKTHNVVTAERPPDASTRPLGPPVSAGHDRVSGRSTDL
ncbi:hypothetical protein SDC9_63383 [bioreactor metagenome]|uniref:Uncharacterized protein n=1 Tax=bioreactor metagenome TaxID=1076179 RepID=A0A644XMH0_9ZZZZ